MGNSNLPEFLICILGAIGILLLYIWLRFGVDAALLEFFWWYCLGVCLTGVYIWFHGLKRSRLSSDIAIGNLESSAQGYGWFVGTVADFQQQSGLCAPNGRDCVWYRFYERQADGDDVLAHFLLSLLPKRILAATSETKQTIVLGGGEPYFIYPDGAQVLSRNRVEWEGVHGSCSLDFIEPGEQLYILGELSSQEHHFDRLREVNHLVIDMRADPEQWKRFDLNNNDRLDDDEAELLEHEALRLAREREQELAESPPIHHIRQPADGREFIISTIPPSKLGRKYFRLMLFGLLFFFSAGSICIMFLPVISQA